MLSDICEHEQTRQILHPHPFQFLPHARLIINKIFRVKQFADDDHRFVARKACSPCYSFVRNSGRNCKINILSVMSPHICNKSFFFKYKYTYIFGCNCATAIRVKNNLTTLCYDYTFRRDPRCVKVPSDVARDRRRIVSLEPRGLTSARTRR